MTTTRERKLLKTDSEKGNEGRTLPQTQGLPWPERVAMLSINPDAATRHDVAHLAAELMEARQLLRSRNPGQESEDR